MIGFGKYSKKYKKENEVVIMNIYAAPMEGITGYVYRRALNEVFGYYDKYFMPFISPNQKGHFSAKEKENLSPDNNAGMYAVPQILTRNADDFIETAKKIAESGYTEVNLNLGCPSRTVVTKGRGAGFLQYPEELKRFLDRIFAWSEREKSRGSGCDISIKTRVGMECEEEFDPVLSIYGQLPYKELIVHPRLQADYYKYPVRPHMFKKVYDSFISRGEDFSRLCYNGDIFTRADAEKMTGLFPGVVCVMIGRGMLSNPGLAREIKTGMKATAEELTKFHDRIYEDLREIMSGPVPTLFKMKELWFYMKDMFDERESEPFMKKIKKARRLPEYEEAARSLLLCPMK